MTAKKDARTQRKISEAIDRLAGLFPYGHLLAETDPAQLLNEASTEIKRLRKAAGKASPKGSK